MSSTGRSYVNLLIVILFMTALLPAIVTAVQGVNTTAWTFTAAAGAITLWLLTPFVVIAGAVIYVLASAMRGK